MHDPIAYTYEADTHCPACAAERFGRAPICPPDCETRHPGLHDLNGGAQREPSEGRCHLDRWRDPDTGECQHTDHDKHWYYPWPPEDARDSEGNPVGAIASWDDWCGDQHPTTLICGTCGDTIAECSD